MEKFAQRRPTVIDFDDRIQMYYKIQNDISQQPLEKEVEFVLLHLGPLSRSLQDNARQWILSLGKILNDSARESLLALKAELEVNYNMILITCFIDLILQGLSNDLKCSPTSLEELKFVLEVIANIRSMSLDVEMRYRDIQERYRTLAMYNIPVPEDEEEIAQNIGQVWMDLFREAKMVDRSLVSVKKKFTVITQEQVTEFMSQCNEFGDKFKTEGPSTVGTDLDKGTYANITVPLYPTSLLIRCTVIEAISVSVCRNGETTARVN